MAWSSYDDSAVSYALQVLWFIDVVFSHNVAGEAELDNIVLSSLLGGSAGLKLLSTQLKTDVSDYYY